MILDAIYRYPVKSLAGEALDAAALDARGVRYDRHWMVVDGAGRFLTQRELPQMCMISAELLADGTLTLTAPDATPLPVAAGGGEPLEVTVWRDTLEAVAPDVDADLWLSDYLGVDCRLVSLPAATVRSVNPEYAKTTDQVGFADGYPFLLLSRASLEDLSTRVGRPLDMLRFRPNLVVDGCEAYAEDDWKRLRIGEVTFRVAKPCVRCAIPTLDPDTGERDPLVMRTLMSYRRRDGAVVFGQNLLHDGTGRLERGMAVEVLD